MKQSYATKSKKAIPKTSMIRTKALLEYRLGSAEAKALLDGLSKEYGHPAPSVKEVRAMLDKAIGDRALTEVLYNLRQED